MLFTIKSRVFRWYVFQYDGTQCILYMCCTRFFFKRVGIITAAFISAIRNSGRLGQPDIRFYGRILEFISGSGCKFKNLEINRISDSDFKDLQTDRQPLTLSEMRECKEAFRSETIIF